MTNSEILQYIISQLHSSPLNYKGDKELFELIFSPIPYGNEIENRRKVAKQPILDIFKNSSKFDKAKFTKLANNIICGENEDNHRQEVIDCINNEIKRLNIKTDVNIPKIVKNIPCKGINENNYRSRFSHWKKNSTTIHDKSIKNTLEKNFDFDSKLWSRGDTFIKDSLQRGIDKFIKRHTKQDTDIFNDIRKKFGLIDKITEHGLNDLQTIKNMNRQEIEQYIKDLHPLSENRSQKFIIELIFVLYSKGYYKLLLYGVLDALDEHHREDIKIKKLQAHALGSSMIGEYKKAFDLLSTIKTDDDKEIIDMQTEAISNIRRYHLNDTKVDKNEKKEIISNLISYYEDVFKEDNSYHYYPGINLSYILAISSNLFDDPKGEIKNISEIYKKAKESIEIDKQSEDTQKQYYANITIIEFMILRGVGNPIAELERFLEFEKENISLIELERTQRQMQFFVNIVEFNQTSIISNMQKSIEIIDAFIDWQLQSK